jgi:YHS domain-containing protein
MREKHSPWLEETLSPELRKESAVLSKSLIILMIFVLVGLSAAVAVYAQREGSGSMGCCCCGSGTREGSGSMEGMAGMSKGKAQQPLPEGRKKVGEEFVCPVDGMRMKVTEQTPTAEYQGKVYYFCNEADKQAFLQDPERYAKGKSAE